MVETTIVDTTTLHSSKLKLGRLDNCQNDASPLARPPPSPPPTPLNLPHPPPPPLVMLVSSELRNILS